MEAEKTETAAYQLMLDQMETNTNHVSDRRAASAKRDSDVAANEYPIITKSAYEQIYRNGEQMDPNLRALCIGRNKLSGAMLALDDVLKKWNPQHTKKPENKAVYNKMVAIRRDIERLLISYPLTLK